MEQSETDWGEWSLNNSEVETNTDDQSTDIKIKVPGEEDMAADVGFYEDYDNGNGSGESEDSGDDGSSYGDTIEVKTHDQTLYFANQQGMAQCEYCGRYGVRDAFYSKTKQFCSMACSRDFATAVKCGKPIPKQTGALPLQIKTHMKKDRSPAKKLYHFNLTRPQGSNRTFSWDVYLEKTQAKAAPVSLFKHCPMSRSWENIAEGMKVEVCNKDCRLPTTVYWIATVIQLSGYKARMRYEGFGSDGSKDFWLNLCSKNIYPVGWCAANGKPLVPPKSIENKYVDWKEFLVKRLTGARTLPHDFYYMVQEELRDIPLRKGMKVEVVDKMCVSSLRVAAVEEVIGGRLMLRYDSAPYDNDTFWCHHRSPLLHPVGWSQLVGHKMSATQDYKDKSLEKIRSGKYDKRDCKKEMVQKMPASSSENKFHVGMKLESIDPLNLSTICVATVKKVLKDDFLMVGIDGSMAEGGSDWFCYHASSPSIFPAGFCEINSLHLTPPKNHKVAVFHWFEYLKQTRSVAAPVKLFDKEIPKHGFRIGMKLEAVDLMDPRLVCVGTISKVVGRLLRIHFDGWDDTYDQWIDCQSADIYPVGWCEMVGYYLEGPRPKDPPTAPTAMKTKPVPKRKRAKSQIYRGPRKKRKPKNVMVHRIKLEPQPSIEFSEPSQDSFASDMSQNKDGKTVAEVPDTVAEPMVQSVLSTSMPAITTMLNSPPRQSADQLSSSGGVSQVVMHNIPRLVPGEPENGGNNGDGNQQSIAPTVWSVFDVCQFLRINDCGQYSDSFRKKNIDGQRFLELSKEQIVNLTGMKVGPSLKIFDLIQSLKVKVSNQPKATASEILAAKKRLTLLSAPSAQC